MDRFVCIERGPGVLSGESGAYCYVMRVPRLFFKHVYCVCVKVDGSFLTMLELAGYSIPKDKGLTLMLGLTVFLPSWPCARPD